MKNPDKMSERELRSEVKTWRMIGQSMLNSIGDWSTGHIDRNHYVTEGQERTIREIVE